MSDIVEGWLWRDPGEIIERLLERSTRQSDRAAGTAIGHAQSASHRDRYYTQARQCEIRAAVKRAMRGEL